jgi:hypothetical protein
MRSQSQALSELTTLNRIRRARKAAAAVLFDEPSADELRREEIEVDVMLDQRWPA